MSRYALSGHHWSGDLPVARFYNETLLAEAQRECMEVVLVSPRNPLNIGAVARAMANFGLARLTVVSPFEEHWREARSAVGAPELLQNARECATLAEALARCTLVVGTGTCTHRKPEQPAILLPVLVPWVAEELARGGRIALVFGPEKHGLTRDDLSRCHLLVEIPTDAHQPSMNLGQAVAVCLYELTRSHRAETPAPLDAQPPADSGTLDRLAEVVEDAMTAAGYSPPTMKEANRHDLRLLLRRLSWGQADARRVLGVFRRIVWRLRHEQPRA
jgi:TrmH family RNA methyltransferase